LRLIEFQRGASIWKTIPPKISKVTPNVRTLYEQLTSFETFSDFAHQLGALQVQAVDATISDVSKKVELFFLHSDFPEARFGYRAKAPGEDVHEKLWLAEELATGALHRIMRDITPAADAAGTTWLRLDGQLLRADS
jgi:hypothetical protein